MASSGREEGESFPLQQKLLICCLLLLMRNGKSREIQLGKVSGVLFLGVHKFYRLRGSVACIDLTDVNF